MKILAIIPCYNEDQSIKYTVDNLKARASHIDCIVINDGSTDNTRIICLDNNYPMIDLPFNLGLANAVQTGMRYACKNGYDMALQFDGDGQHLPEYIPYMVELMQETGADIVIGSRYMLKRSLGLRGFGGSLLRVAVKISTGKKLSDPSSGMRLYNRRMIEKLANHMNHGPEPDTLVCLINQGATVLECPVTMRERISGKSYFGLLNAVNYMLRMLVSIVIVSWFRVKGGQD